ncbi:MAG: GGDEF domain-containing protein [Candidatus Aminicenantes bacterium]|nr:GGDEF domain-containing protein [Candidatus Aminicenantes bacterium]
MRALVFGRKGIGRIAAAALFLSPLFADIEYRGFPLITNFPPEKYNAEIQNWAALQDDRGLLYVANSSGVLEFDGLEWRLIRLPENIAVRSLAKDRTGRIFVGALGDFGYLEANDTGGLVFHSLGRAEGLSSSDIGDVYTAEVSREGIVFQSGNGVFLYRDGRILVLRPETRFFLGFAVQDRFYVRQEGRGLYRLDGVRLEFLPGSERFAGDRIHTMLALDLETILLGSYESGFFFYHSGRMTPDSFEKTAAFAEMERILKGQKIGVGERLSDGRLAFATTQSGLYICSPDGRLLDHLDKSTGLLNDCIYYLYRDPLDNLILCQSVGLSYVETGTPLRLINDKSGIKGAGASALFRPAFGPGAFPGLVLGTYQGVFFRDWQDSGLPYRRIPGSMETLSLIERRGRILVAQNDGIAELRGDRLIPIIRKQIGVSFLTLANRPDSLLAGTFTGFFRLEFREGNWISRGPVAGFTQGCFNPVEAPDGTIWLQTYAGNGIFRLALSEDLGRVVEERNYTKANGLPSDGGNLLFQGKNRFYIATSRGVYRYNARRDVCEPDPDFPEPGLECRPVQLIHEAENGDVWVSGEGFFGVYRSGADGRYGLETGLLNRLPVFRPNTVICIPDERNILVGYKDGFIHFNPSQISPPAASQPVLIRSIHVNERLLFAGGPNVKDDSEPGEAPAGEGPAIPHAKNQIRFSYAAPSIEGGDRMEYRTRLEGYEDDWSSWSRWSTRPFSNLSEGSYVFLVEARDLYGKSEGSAAYHFVILPPWYRTWPAYLGYALLVLAAVAGIVTIYNRRLIKEKIRLERLVNEKTRQLKDAALTDPLTGLRNRRFLSEILQGQLNTYVAHREYSLVNRDRRNPDAGSPAGYAFFMIDLDHFKDINDNFGHAAGDRMLQLFAETLRANVRVDDIIMRFGGEEFLIILKEPDRDYAEVFAEKLRASVERTPFNIGESGPVHRTCSIGYVHFPFYPESPRRVAFDQAIRIADLGLYHAKTHGRNMTAGVFPTSKSAGPEEAAAMLSKLDAAVERRLIRIEIGQAERAEE